MQKQKKFIPTRLDIMFGKRIDQLLKIYNKTQAWLAQQINVEKTDISGMINHTRPVSKEKILKICNALGITVEEFFRFEEDFVYIPMVEGKISAGKGLIPDTDVEIKLAFRYDFIKRYGDPHKMSLIRVEGDSMEPTFYSGDIVLVDHQRNYVAPQGGIYAITFDDLIMVKRLQVNPDRTIKIISDNPRYEPAIVKPEDITINGKVIWFSRVIEK